MRGKRCGVAAAVVTYRIIPAHAGQTTPIVTAWYRTPDHPRACGANTSTRSAYSTLVGSSPRMRGKLGFGSTRQCRPRIIPAHAGQTDDAVFSMLRHPDHPRACGANIVITTAEKEEYGSSPRMRGKPVCCVVDIAVVRIIPAHAGQTAAGGSATKSRTDHPRACGANVTARPMAPSRCGSSPRMRGKPQTLGIAWVCGRIIPAHAGQTPTDSQHDHHPADHPRACGANGGCRGVVGVLFGSSPRMRGKPCKGIKGRHRVRIIPAHAGQTSTPKRSVISSPDHPRACGANPCLVNVVSDCVGSSPRMRGKLRP